MALGINIHSHYKNDLQILITVLDKKYTSLSLVNMTLAGFIILKLVDLI